MNHNIYSSIGTSILLLILMISESSGQPPIHEQTDLQSIIGLLNRAEETESTDGKKLIFMIRFTDFGCQPCLRNFFELCDSVGIIRKRSRAIPVYLFFLREQSDPGYQLTTMTSWAKSSGLPYPVAIVPPEVFKRHGIGHSSILIIGYNDTLHFRGEIPVSQGDLRHIIRTIQK